MIGSSTVLGMVICAASVVACGSTERENISRSIAGVALLDNMEDGNTQTLADEAGYKGFWYTYDDKPECDNLNPTAGTTWPPPENPGAFVMTDYASAELEPAPEAPGGGANNMAVRFKGEGHSLWGAGIGFQLLEGKKFDLTQEFSGVRFWGISPSGEQTVAVKIPDAGSTPADGMCIPRDIPTCSEQGCYADPQATRTFKTTWELFEIDFSEFVPPNYGKYTGPPPTMLDPTTAYQIQFQVGKVPAPGFDLFIDNVGLILKNP